MFDLSTRYTGNPGRFGFSMIEVMVAIAVLATVMTVLASNLYTLNNVRATMKERAVAQEIARLMSERIQSEVFANLGTGATQMGWSVHRRLTPAPGSKTPTNPMTETAKNPEDNLIAQGLLQQPSEIAGLSVFLEYYRQSLIDTMAASGDPALVWKDVTTCSGSYAGDNTNLCPDLNPIQDAQNNPGEFVIIRVIVRWNSRIGGSQQHEFTVAKKE